MLPKTLSGKALRHLRALGHDLDPVIAVGKNGVTDSLAKEAKRALHDHELIKVRVMQEVEFLLYRRNDKKPKIVLPKAGPAPKAE